MAFHPWIAEFASLIKTESSPNNHGTITAHEKIIVMFSDLLKFHLHSNFPNFSSNDFLKSNLFRLGSNQGPYNTLDFSLISNTFVHF